MDKTLPINGKFQLMELPYGLAELEPVISEQTLSVHHGKHLAAYVNNLNAAVSGTEWEGRALDDIVVSAAEGGILNNAGQILNHNLYFEQFRPPCDECEPAGELAIAIASQFGDMEQFIEQFEHAGATLFGSGWVWLAADDKGLLEIMQCRNAGNPLRHGRTPLLTMDVWEHAYYLDYQNRRPDHLKALWQLIDWNVINQRYTNR